MIKIMNKIKSRTSKMMKNKKHQIMKKIKYQKMRIANRIIMENHLILVMKNKIKKNYLKKMNKHFKQILKNKTKINQAHNFR